MMAFMSRKLRGMEIVVGAALAAGLWACEAKIEDLGCEGGDFTCDGSPASLTASSSAASSGAGGGGGGGPVCLEGCDTMTVSNVTGEFPPEVDEVLENCRRCHTTPLANGAPFPFDTYEETQNCTSPACTDGLYAGQTLWARMIPAVASDFMPLTAPKYSDEEKAILLDDWACLCAPPAE